MMRVFIDVAKMMTEKERIMNAMRIVAEMSRRMTVPRPLIFSWLMRYGRFSCIMSRGCAAGYARSRYVPTLSFGFFFIRRLFF